MCRVPRTVIGENPSAGVFGGPDGRLGGITPEAAGPSGGTAPALAGGTEPAPDGAGAEEPAGPTGAPHAPASRTASSTGHRRQREAAVMPVGRGGDGFPDAGGPDGAFAVRATGCACRSGQEIWIRIEVPFWVSTLILTPAFATFTPYRMLAARSSR